MNTFTPRCLGALRAACHPSNCCEIPWGTLQGIIEDEFTRWLEEQKPGKIPEALRSALFDELCRFEGIDPKKVGASAGRIAKALKAVRLSDNDVTPDEIRKRGKAYLKAWPGLTPTAQGLANHWPALGTNGHDSASQAAIPEPPMWQDRLQAEFPECRYVREGHVLGPWSRLSEQDQKQITEALK
jgi:hypothetical protein